jgi:hypothetical protein
MLKDELKEVQKEIASRVSLKKLICFKNNTTVQSIKSFYENSDCGSSANRLNAPAEQSHASRRRKTHTAPTIRAHSTCNCVQ